MHSYDELRSHFPFLIPQQTTIPAPAHAMSAACLPEYAHSHSFTQYQVPYGAYPAYVSTHPPCVMSSYVSTATSPARFTASPHTTVKMSSETSAFQPISHSSVDRRSDGLSLQRCEYDH